jgi:nitroreductase
MYALNKFILKAPILIAVVTERSKYTALLGGHFRGIQYALVDIGIAGQHLDLAATELGLGCCWLGWFDEKAVKKVLRLPQSTRIDIMFSLGYPQQGELRKKARKELSEIRTYF